MVIHMDDSKKKSLFYQFLNYGYSIKKITFRCCAAAFETQPRQNWTLVDIQKSSLF